MVNFKVVLVKKEAIIEEYGVRGIFIDEQFYPAEEKTISVKPVCMENRSTMGALDIITSINITLAEKEMDNVLVLYCLKALVAWESPAPSLVFEAIYLPGETKIPEGITLL